jgi:hypothetical protein
VATSLRHIGGGQFVFRGRNIGPDYSYPGVASELGWSTRRVQKRDGETVVLQRTVDTKQNCRHSSTDGTVDCRECGVTAQEFISAAGDFLHERAQ